MEHSKTNGSPDWLLAMMVKVVETNAREHNDAPFHVTLLVGGLLVSGRLIDETTYLKSVGGGSLYEIMQEAIAKLDEDEPPREADKAAGESKPRYIHLADVQILTPVNPLVSGEKAPLWRGRLSSVDAFSFGTLSVSATPAHAGSA